MQPRGFLYIAIASNRGGPCDTEIEIALDAAQANLMRMGWLSARAVWGTSDLEDTRNFLATTFYLEKKYTHALFLDDDVGFEPGAIERMVTHPVDFVLGAYPIRRKGEGFALRTLPGPMTWVDPSNNNPHPMGLAKIAGGPGGFMRLTRNVIERLVEADPDRWYQHKHTSNNKAWQFFEFDVIDHERISEDMNFCRKWRQLGGDVWVDPHIMLHHFGRTAFSGRFADHAREIARVADPDKVQKIRLGSA